MHSPSAVLGSPPPPVALPRHEHSAQLPGDIPTAHLAMARSPASLDVSINTVFTRSCAYWPSYLFARGSFGNTMACLIFPSKDSGECLPPLCTTSILLRPSRASCVPYWFAPCRHVTHAHDFALAYPPHPSFICFPSYMFQPRVVRRSILFFVVLTANKGVPIHSWPWFRPSILLCIPPSYHPLLHLALALLSARYCCGFSTTPSILAMKKKFLRAHLFHSSCLYEVATAHSPGQGQLLVMSL